MAGRLQHTINPTGQPRLDDDRGWAIGVAPLGLLAAAITDAHLACMAARGAVAVPAGRSPRRHVASSAADLVGIELSTRAGLFVRSLCDFLCVMSKSGGWHCRPPVVSRLCILSFLSFSRFIDFAGGMIVSITVPVDEARPLCHQETWQYMRPSHPMYDCKYRSRYMTMAVRLSRANERKVHPDGQTQKPPHQSSSIWG